MDSVAWGVPGMVQARPAVAVDAGGAAPGSRTSEVELRRLSQSFEAAFISEMLKHAGFGAASGAFSGGVGEDQFASLMRDAQAQELAVEGGFGLAEQIFDAIWAREASLERKAE